jgi:hypothetical protein
MNDFKDRFRRSGLLVSMTIITLLPMQAPSQTAVASNETIDTIWTVPNVSALPRR